MNNNQSLLKISDLVVEFHTEDGVVRAVDGVNLVIERGKTLGLVGESGSGKSVTALSIMRLIAQPVGKISKGEIEFEENNLLGLSERALRKIRGNRISMIFQEPMTSLNPVFTVGEQIMEAISLHQGLDKKAALKKSIEMLQLVGIPSPKERVFNYPHQMSGGMRQRVMIAMALSCKPELLIADEPTTALDVTIQAQIMELMKKLQEEFKMGILLITHDLGVVAETCDRVAVMYAGQIVEEAEVGDIFKSPIHPYTVGLLSSVPGYSRGEESVGPDGKPRLKTIPGMVPNLLELKKGCRFYDRCYKRKDECMKQDIALVKTQRGRSYRCLFPEHDLQTKPLLSQNKKSSAKEVTHG
ncbi:MAG: ABC transporter ATP-binding protein [Myxococcales bacterium]|nr:ABC transporter ATP-binding protein [Myxococcales bacterium]